MIFSVTTSLISIHIPYYQINSFQRYNGETYQGNICLPVTINKFLMFKKIKGLEFLTKWDITNRFSTNEKQIKLNVKIFKTLNILKQFLSDFVVLNTQQEQRFGSEEITWELGAIFNFANHKDEFLLKITIKS